MALNKQIFVGDLGSKKTWIYLKIFVLYKGFMYFDLVNIIEILKKNLDQLFSLNSDFV